MHGRICLYYLTFVAFICINLPKFTLYYANICNTHSHCYTSYYSYETMKAQGLKEERFMLLEAWRYAENTAITTTTTTTTAATIDRQHLEAVEARFPRKIKMKRPVLAEDGVTELGSEEYFDYVFPDDEKKMGKRLSVLFMYIPVVYLVHILFICNV